MRTCVLEAVATPAKTTVCHQEADLAITPAVSVDNALVVDEIRNESDEADATQSCEQDGCTVEAGSTDVENNCASTTDAKVQLSRRKRQRLCKSGSKLFSLGQYTNPVSFDF